MKFVAHFYVNATLLKIEPATDELLVLGFANRIGDWIDRDQQWVEENRGFVELVFDYFVRFHTWPKNSEFRRYLFQRGMDVDVQSIADQKPVLPMWNQQPGVSFIALGARHMLMLPKAGSLLNLAVAATVLALEVFQGPDEHPTVTYDDQRFFSYTSTDVILLPRLFESDYPSPLGGGGDDHWTMWVNELDIFDFVEAKSPETYVECQRKVIEKLVSKQSTFSASSTPEERFHALTGPKGSESSSISEPQVASGQIFIVHGHDLGKLDEVVDTVKELTGRDAIILSEMPNRGQTIIEKFERHAVEAGFVVVLATADDVGRERDSLIPQPRARQNVVFELGFFIGALGRPSVLILYDEGVELPSDMDGVIYVLNDAQGKWRSDLKRELTAADFIIDTATA